MKIIWWVFGLIMLLAVTTAGYYVVVFRASAPVPVAPAVSVGPGQSQLYVSKALGVAFRYIPAPIEGGSVGVKETGDTIFLSYGTLAPESGQFVEVFSKDPSETFADAIRRRILAGYPSPDCKIEVTPSSVRAGYQTAEISYPLPADQNANQMWFANAALCNAKYDRTNGIRYFLYDPKHPDQFAYLDIGQYSIFGQDKTPWQDTLTFMK